MAANNEIEAATAALKGMAHSEQHYFNRSVRERKNERVCVKGKGGSESRLQCPRPLLTACWLAMNADK